MKPVKIISDSTCDLSEDLKQRYDVQIVPLYVTLGQESFTDGLTITPGDIYRYFEQTKQTPKTAAATVADFYAAFEPHAKEGRDIVFIGISSKMSATVSQAELAAKEFPGIRIRCIDSQSLSSGIGLSVLAACDLAEQGLTADEIASRIHAMVPRVRASFVIDTMTFLYYGGRCSAVKAYGATLLKIKPQISVTDGSMH
ncbi:MAG TPA: DegV family protein, partial [Clostridia bacterium]|nr:DegV family protein [Clostridia bacterium]